jgi:golgi phosphoprotein 3
MIMLLAEELLLLSLDDESGKLSTSVGGYLGYALAGAFLIDLQIQGKIAIDAKKKVKITDPSPVKDDILQDMFLELKSAKKPKNIQDWIYELGNYYNKFRDLLFHRLREQGILGRFEKSAMKIFSFVRHPLLKPEVKIEILERIQSLILKEREPDDHTVGLLSLIKSSNLLNSLFAKDFRKQAIKRIDELIISEKIGKAVADLIEGIASSFVTIIATTATFT